METTWHENVIKVTNLVRRALPQNATLGFERQFLLDAVGSSFDAFHGVLADGGEIAGQLHIIYGQVSAEQRATSVAETMHMKASPELYPEAGYIWCRCEGVVLRNSVQEMHSLTPFRRDSYGIIPSRLI